ncbi:hypothetical protein C8Q80DRAFT_1354619 [Daedaleopsis nitida]|nr:hypothetical protein C8Q80DRAFT_1354619 [Daedaleopsis nitida]
MARGVSTILALTVTRDYPTMLTNIAAQMDKELAKVREQYLLPLEFDRWAHIVSARSNCNYETFAAVATHQFECRRGMLFDVYADMGDLQCRLDGAVLLMNAAFEDTDDLWQKLRMLYDSYLLRLEKHEFDAIEKVFPALIRQYNDVQTATSATNALSEHWQSRLEMVLTEAGLERIKQTLDERRVWITEVLPTVIQGVAVEFKSCADGRAKILSDVKALSEEHIMDWCQRSGSHLPTFDFGSTLTQYVNLLAELARLEKGQEHAAGQLKDSMKLVDRYTSTLPVDGDDVPIGQVQEVFLQYEVIWARCARIAENCSRLKASMHEHKTTLEKCRDEL